MYKCLNCGGELKFNITLQQLTCEHCDSRYETRQFGEEDAVEADNAFDVTVFTCPQCAGELYTTDNTMTGFCSFCGSQVMLESRIEREERPDYIIPFQKTKEDCKQAYMKVMRKAIFAPKELKKEKYIDGFRGIYMPYWIYDVKQKENLALDAKTSERHGDYIYTSYYIINGELDAFYNGVSYDASSSFADNISEKIAPFKVSRMKPFSPAYLSGFYADVADVDASVYEEDVKEKAGERTIEYIKRNDEVRKYILRDDDEVLKRRLGTVITKEERAMFPVWFLSYRNKDRVAYATVNGQTGKVVADLPVDIKKYMLGAGIVAIPIFFLLNMFLTVTPSVLLGIIIVISMIVSLMHASEMKKISIREGYADDKGLQEALQMKERKALEEKYRVERELAVSLGEEYYEPLDLSDKMKRTQKDEKDKKNKKKKADKTSMAEILIILTMLLVLLPFLIQSLAADQIILGVASIALIVTVVAALKSMRQLKNLDKKHRMPAALYCVIASLLAMATCVLKPVEDLYYYGAAVVSLVAIFFTLFDLICKYNILATRKLPQFEYKGGDNRA